MSNHFRILKQAKKWMVSEFCEDGDRPIITTEQLLAMQTTTYLEYREGCAKAWAELQTARFRHKDVKGGEIVEAMNKVQMWCQSSNSILKIAGHHRSMARDQDKDRQFKTAAKRILPKSMYHSICLAAAEEVDKGNVERQLHEGDSSDEVSHDDAVLAAIYERERDDAQAKCRQLAEEIERLSVGYNNVVKQLQERGANRLAEEFMGVTQLVLSEATYTRILNRAKQKLGLKP